MDRYKFIGSFKQIVTMRNVPLKGALTDDQIEIITDGGILVKNDQIAEVDKYDQLLAKAKSLNAQFHEISHPMVVLPGFVDAHTHICFSGSRASDYALRNSGATYLEIAKAGGGIWDTVTHTRAATLEELVENTVTRAKEHFNRGVTTIEVKSGYGLSVNEELKMLQAINKAKERCLSDIVPTCLAAHIVPKEFNGNATAYLEQVVDDLFPMIKKNNLCTRVDAFIEEGAFDASNIEHYLYSAKENGFDITIHADQFHPGGSEVAVTHGAISADHLEASAENEIQLLANSNVIATALPGASIGLGCSFTPARKILDAGCCLAIASDWNPGSAPMGNLLASASILGSFEKLTNAEVLAGITLRAAAALNLHDRGRITRGQKADFISFPTQSYKEITYKQGQMSPIQVWKDGELKTNK